MERIASSSSSVMTSTARVERPYSPSWFDRLTAWVERRRIPPGFFYLGLSTILFVAEVAIQWGPARWQ